MTLIINELETELLDPAEPAAPEAGAGGEDIQGGELPLEMARAMAILEERRARLQDD